MNNNVGYLLRSQAGLSNDYHEGSFDYHLSGTMRAQQPPYRKDAVVIGQLQSDATERVTALQRDYAVGLVSYPRSGQYRAGQRKE